MRIISSRIENTGIQINAPSVLGKSQQLQRPDQQPQKSNVTEESEEIKQRKRLGLIDCETCSSRRYVDGSNDPGVSFKSPTKMNPSEASSKVISHEREHYFREAAKAEQEDKEVLSNSIQIHTSICSECGKTYVSGGLTTTVTKDKKNDNYGSLHSAQTFLANIAYGLNLDIKDSPYPNQDNKNVQKK